MRRRIMMVAGAALLAGWLPAAAGSPLSVQVRSTQVRSTPSFLGAVVESLAYGDTVDSSGKQGPWTQVRTPEGKTGWVHESALGAKKVAMQAGGRDVATEASGDELALAGKAFSADVEAAFKEAHQDVDFTWVDRMEKMTVSVQESITFLKDGQVKPAEGGAR